MTNPDVEKLANLSDKMPFANTILGQAYTGFINENLKNESLAAHYFFKADEKACLGKEGAGWLLRYYRNGGQLQLSERDIQRLQKLAGEKKSEKPVLMPCSDETLEEAVNQILQKAMTEYDCANGMVYVVKTESGVVKAQVSLSGKGKEFVPYEDSYHDEQSALLAGPTYLALLSSGKISADEIIDTGCGIYKEVKDHNWRRGGYGVLTLEQALGCCSQVAFTKAKEAVFGNDQSTCNQKISSYLGADSDYVSGILTFYNAVANGGRMMQLLTEDDYVEIVLDNQIAADNPMYTIMVVLEKNGLPASAGGMCGPIMASTIDTIVDLYNLRSAIARNGNTESVEESDVIVYEEVVQ